MRKSNDKRRANVERGAEMAEFALSFLLFLILVVGIFEGGRLVWTYETLAHAARQGARFAIVHGERNPLGDDTAITAAVQAQAVGLPSGDLTVNTVWSDADKKGGSVVTVSATYPISFIASPLVFGANGLSLTARSQATVAD
ncbi:MAG: TadE/TadG family type IV pilus assembly protein [Acidobacteria bacterium]|nr:TadE/TadG family type IV pilus assembly protein [Acidobacteriota bacterium]MDA1236087.1 TadE/TadG family type IV pilus assembly protein [Acidobacteriota bacterium]